MGFEIERKFLVDHFKWHALAKPAGKLLMQGYILSDERRTVRIRIAEDRAYLTIKGSTTGITRREYEYDIPVNEATEILNDLTISKIEKTRHEIWHAGKLWEVDVFSGDNGGLIIAEIELNAEDEQFEKPDWITQEVSDDHRYSNSHLAVSPFKDWGGVTL